MTSKNRASGFVICWFLCLGLLLLPHALARAQTVTATVPVVGGPVSVALNPLTNKIYVGDYRGRKTNGNITVINGATNSVITTVPAGIGVIDVAVNPLTNKIYVANSESGNVTKLRASDGANVGSFAVEGSPQGIAFDGAHIWVANSNSNSVSRF